jgi:hypothetical protein
MKWANFAFDFEIGLRYDFLMGIKRYNHYGNIRKGDIS